MLPRLTPNLKAFLEWDPGTLWTNEPLKLDRETFLGSKGSEKRKQSLQLIIWWLRRVLVPLWWPPCGNRCLETASLYQIWLCAWCTLTIVLWLICLRCKQPSFVDNVHYESKNNCLLSNMFITSSSCNTIIKTVWVVFILSQPLPTMVPAFNT